MDILFKFVKQPISVWFVDTHLRQPSIEKIDNIVDTHRAGILILKKIAECLIKEAECWQANVTALRKARLDEQKALEKAERKAAQLKQKEEEKAKQKAVVVAKGGKIEESEGLQYWMTNNDDVWNDIRRIMRMICAKQFMPIRIPNRCVLSLYSQYLEAEKEAQKEQERIDKEKNKDGEDGGDKEGGAAKASKRRRLGGVDTLTPEDPMILREMSKFNTGSLPFCEELSEFAMMIGQSPHLVWGCRLKRGIFKKVIQVLYLNLKRMFCLFVFLFMLQS